MDYFCLDRKSIKTNVYSYFIKEVDTNKAQWFDADNLKNLIRSGQMNVLNLTLTSDNRLILYSKPVREFKRDVCKNAKVEEGTFLIQVTSKDDKQLEKDFDSMIRDSINIMFESLPNNARLKSFDKDNNIIILQLRKGSDIFLYLNYGQDFLLLL